MHFYFICFVIKKEEEDILSRFLMESEKNPDEMKDEYLRDIILNFMIAGKDSSANTLSWFLYMLCKNPLVQEKVAQEVRDHVNGGKLDETDIDDFITNLTDTTLEQMHYLHAALAETLRLYPAVPVVISTFLYFFEKLSPCFFLSLPKLN